MQDQFHRHLLLEAERRQLRPIIENKSRILLVHTTSGYKYALLSLSLFAPHLTSQNDSSSIHLCANHRMLDARASLELTNMLQLHFRERDSLIGTANLVQITFIIVYL